MTDFKKHNQSILLKCFILYKIFNWKIKLMNFKEKQRKIKYICVSGFQN